MSTDHFLAECRFQTERLHVEHWTYRAAAQRDETVLAERIIAILTPEVTKALPPGWQDIHTAEEATEWIKARDEESEVFTIQSLPESLLVGFLFLNAEHAPDPKLIDVRLGYLLAEEVWGKGLGSELIKGLVDWCEKVGNISSLSGGVETSNQASIRILEKNGFRSMPAEESLAGMMFLEKKFSLK